MPAVRFARGFDRYSMFSVWDDYGGPVWAVRPVFAAHLVVYSDRIRRRLSRYAGYRRNYSLALQFRDS